MLRTTLTLACAVMALAFTANANAQSCGSCGISGGYSHAMNFSGYDGYGMMNAGGSNCGREISNLGAAALWAGYCTESCATATSRQRCSLFKGGRRNHGGGLAGKFGYPGGGCGCNSGCFGYPSACGCGGGAGAGLGLGLGLGGFGHGGGCSLFGKLKNRGGCNLLSKLKGIGGGSSLFNHSSSCELGFGGGFGTGGGCGSSCGLGGFNGFGLFSKRKGRSGCKLFGKLKGRRTTYAAVITQPVTTVAIDQCGCGNSGQYFNYAVGAEYGTAGMQSDVSQVLSGSSCCDGASSVLDSGVQLYENTGAAPIMQ